MPHRIRNGSQCAIGPLPCTDIAACRKPTTFPLPMKETFTSDENECHNISCHDLPSCSFRYSDFPAYSQIVITRCRVKRHYARLRPTLSSEPPAPLKNLGRRVGAVRRKNSAEFFRVFQRCRCERLYLIPFATHAFVLECQERASALPSLSVFP